MCLTQTLLFTLIQVWRVTDRNNPSGGRRKSAEIDHINVFDLKARFIGVDILQGKKLQTCQSNL